MVRSRWLALVLLLGCGAPEEPVASPLPSLLLVTLDTTRADAIEPESTVVATPTLAALAARGVRFRHAYTVAPQTLPAHASMLTGLYPGGHGLHENARTLPEAIPTLPERLRSRGYATAAFVSAFPLERQFGLGRGFDTYDDQFGDDRAERSAALTTERALSHLASFRGERLFLWVHYYDPHEPYAPPEPYKSRYPASPYHAEIAAMDAELGRLLAAFEARFPEHRLLVVGDHGEGLGEHGEAYHGNLLYQGVMRVPLLLAGTGIAPSVRSEPASTRRVYDTFLGWAGEPAAASLVEPRPEPVLGEALKPYLLYGWQPQLMAVEGTRKVIRSGTTEIYDVEADPGETRDLATTERPTRTQAEALQGYPLPDPQALDTAPSAASEAARKQLASLGYVAAEAPPPFRPDAPSPKDKTALFADLDLGSGLFVRERYAEAIPVFERVLAKDPGNFTAALRLGVASSVTGKAREAERWFERAAAIFPASLDLALYRGLHHFRLGDDGRAAPLLERVLAAYPKRLPALEALARLRERQEQLPQAADLYERVAELTREPAAALTRLGQLRMAMGETEPAIAAFEQARTAAGAAFAHDLELGVLYLAARRFAEARDSLDRVGPGHPGHAMALFKRAQVAVLLDEPDRAERIERARRAADATTGPLIEREPLFRR